ncbi:MAG TPA: putative toxin-antitoxin system toxin component, PIN family [Blastocatellia bacterium]|nr:putative toxin-antitoxin system toxin component, PIN family [Blastocatellia bacterium]
MALTRIVLDTNVVVSAHLRARGLEAFVLDLALASKLQLYVSPNILEEYEGVLRRPRFGIDPKKVTESIRLIKKRSKTVKPTHKSTISPDPDDNKFLECAEAAGAGYLVTGNRKHFPLKHHKTAVVNAKQFIEAITPELKR